MAKKPSLQPHPPQTASGPSDATSRLWKMLAVAWVIGFSLWFYTFALPNNHPISRIDVWSQVPFLYLDLIDPPPAENGPPSGWRFVGQRVPIFAAAASILLAALAIGRLAWRLLRPPVAINGLEGLVLSWGLGLSLLSLVTLAVGLAGQLERAIFAGVLVVPIVVELLFSLRTKNELLTGLSECRRNWLASRVHVIAFAAVIPFVLVIFAGAMLPSVDFDAKEYHLQGPKEFFLAGQVTFLPHNVYTSFPFLTEMLTLLGMVSYGDWYWGALVGKAVLAGFAPLTGLAVYATARRCGGGWAAPLALLFHLSIPWTYRISTIAGAEGGLTFFLAATVLCVVIFLVPKRADAASADDSLVDDRGDARLMVLLGGLAGSAMACKYPGVVSVVFPAALTICAWYVRAGRTRAIPLAAAMFIVGVLLTIGPWLVKNTIETGNPVYPLLYSVFGGADWDAAMNQKWQAAHRPDGYAPGDIAVKLMDVSAKSDWQSGILFALAPFALWGIPRRVAVLLWVAVAYLFATWWGLTHRLDRFWVPLLPLMAVLAGIGAEELRRRGLSAVVAVFGGLTLLYNFAFITTALCGYNAYLIDLESARQATARITSPQVQFLNEADLPADAKVLSVGDAELFDARFPVVYNTVFDRSLFAELTGDPAGDLTTRDAPLKSTAELREAFREQGITHVYVDWGEILRYRRTYGYTDFVHPGRFAELVRRNILAPAFPSGKGQRSWDSLSTAEQNEVDTWGPELKQEIGEDRIVITAEIFAVVPAEDSRP